MEARGRIDPTSILLSKVLQAEVLSNGGFQQAGLHKDWLYKQKDTRRHIVK